MYNTPANASNTLPQVVITCRVPVDFKIQLIKDAMKYKMGISEYMTFILLDKCLEKKTVPQIKTPQVIKVGNKTTSTKVAKDLNSILGKPAKGLKKGNPVDDLDAILGKATTGLKKAKK